MEKTNKTYEIFEHRRGCSKDEAYLVAYVVSCVGDDVTDIKAIKQCAIAEFPVMSKDKEATQYRNAKAIRDLCNGYLELNKTEKFLKREREVEKARESRRNETARLVNNLDEIDAIVGDVITRETTNVIEKLREDSKLVKNTSKMSKLISLFKRRS